MYCPICGQQQASDAIRFCSRCGFALAGIAQVVANNGAIPFVAQTPNGKSQSARSKGVRQGVFIMMFVLLVPVLAVLSAATGLPRELIALCAVAPPILGLLRIIYALMYESREYVAEANATNNFGQPRTLNAPQNFQALPPQSANFSANTTAAYAPQPQQNYVQKNWRGADTGELKEPSSVTEDTTKLLNNE